MNRVKEFRQKRKLTQATLAELAEIGKATLQRVEAETTPVRIELAHRLAMILDVPLSTLFPELKNIKPGPLRPASDEANFDFSHCDHTAVIAYESGRTVHYKVDEATSLRINGILHNFDGENPFFVFTTPTHEVVARTEAILWANILFDIGFGDRQDPDIEYGELGGMKVYFRGQTDPAEFDLEPDSQSMTEDDDPELDDDFDREGCQNQWLVFDFDSYSPTISRRFIDFIDVDGEVVFLQVEKIEAIEIPIHYTHPKLISAILDGHEDDLAEASATVVIGLFNHRPPHANDPL